MVVYSVARMHANLVWFRSWYWFHINSLNTLFSRTNSWPLTLPTKPIPSLWSVNSEMASLCSTTDAILGYGLSNPEKYFHNADKRDAGEQSKSAANHRYLVTVCGSQPFRHYGIARAREADLDVCHLTQHSLLDVTWISGTERSHFINFWTIEELLVRQSPIWYIHQGITLDLQLLIPRFEWKYNLGVLFAMVIIGDLFAWWVAGGSWLHDKLVCILHSRPTSTDGWSHAWQDETDDPRVSYTCEGYVPKLQRISSSSLANALAGNSTVSRRPIETSRLSSYPSCWHFRSCNG